MIVFFIEESGKKKLLKKCEFIDDKIILNCDINKAKAKLIKKIINYLNVNNCNTVILTKSLKSLKHFTNAFYTNNINIINGRKLFRFLLEEIIHKTCIENSINPINSEISITVNYMDSEISDLIEKLSKKFKLLNIVSNNINSFRNLERRIYEKFGIIINVTNNKKKALKKTNIILNIDFQEELLNRYIINDNAILITFCELNKVKFTGKIITDYNIHLKPDTEISRTLIDNKYINYDLKDLAEIYIAQYPEELKNIIID